MIDKGKPLIMVENQNCRSQPREYNIKYFFFFLKEEEEARFYPLRYFLWVYIGTENEIEDAKRWIKLNISAIASLV